MHYLLAGTNRSGSNTMHICRILQSIYEELQIPVEIMDLAQVPLHDLTGDHYGDKVPASIKTFVDKINKAEGVHIVCPEYNGSMPGVLKYFIDHWKYPESFEMRPVCFVGIGGRFGGVRPVEHLQQIFSYRNGFIYPERVFITNVWSAIKDGQLGDPISLQLLKKQVLGFTTFTRVLKESGLLSQYFKTMASP